MKALNLILLAYGGSTLLILSASVFVESNFGRENGMIMMMPIALLVGLSARRVAEKFLGYTLLEALQGKKDDAGQ